ncbi:MAG: hypothetical protein Q8L45_09750 [Xanthomonadaceae bacterium]|nr:hypothetical protein [Xanthomonadaceae bacterium]MDP2185364.1 hypothetical protein [Xanthomonadales bacterium]MDZ4117264.1 hypothetical protein [Xanthomonadaceae bacterium]MDZ4376675.1 hypothetical protein [Xanthomonadaceae bacterium]
MIAAASNGHRCGAGYAVQPRFETDGTFSRLIRQSPSFPRKRESRDFRLNSESKSRWIPACAGMTQRKEVPL